MFCVVLPEWKIENVLILFRHLIKLIKWFKVIVYEQIGSKIVI